MARLPRRTTASAPNDIAESGQKGVKTVAACISLSTTHISTHAPAQANRHTHTQTPAQTDPDAFSDTVSSSFSRLSAAMGPSYCVFSESGKIDTIDKIDNIDKIDKIDTIDKIDKIDKIR